jgi:hypothetical protein
MMKNGTLILLAVLTLNLCGCASAPRWEGRKAIKHVIAEKENASVTWAYYAVDGRDIANLQIHGVQYLRAIDKIDVSSCPETFRAAWTNYCAAWAQKLKKENADEDTLDLISVGKGEAGDLPNLVRSLEAYDTQPAWNRCEQAARDCGVSIRH